MSTFTPPSEPRPAQAPLREAATLILLRDAPSGASGFEILMVQRQRGASFMADAHVFPGGRLEASDGGDFAVAAAREAFEEAGVLLAADQHGQPVRDLDPTWLAAGRLSVGKGTTPFATLLAEKGLAADTREFIEFARWITPPTEVRRFDARFYMAKMPEGQEAHPDAAGEVVDFRWAPPAQFLEEQRQKKIKLPPPTLWHLTDLSRHATADAALAWARSRAAIASVPVRPKLLPVDGVLTILLPWDADYAAAPISEGEPLPASHPLAGPVTRYVLDDGLWQPRSHPAS